MNVSDWKAIADTPNQFPAEQETVEPAQEFPPFEVLAGSAHWYDLDECAGQMIEALQAIGCDVSELAQELEDLPEDENQNEALDDIIYELIDKAQEYAAPYCSIGWHDGEVICMPCLPDADEVPYVEDMPEEFAGAELLHVNDHGNATLYAWNGSEYREVWAIV